MQEEDRKFLERLAEQEEQDREIATARRERARADATWMKKVKQYCICGMFPFLFSLSHYSLRCFVLLCALDYIIHSCVVVSCSFLLYLISSFHLADHIIFHSILCYLI